MHAGWVCGSGAEGRRLHERDAGEVPEARGTARELTRLDIGAARGVEARVDHGDERAVAAAVVEQAAPSGTFDESPGEVEPAAVAPRDDAARAEDLFSRVVA